MSRSLWPKRFLFLVSNKISTNKHFLANHEILVKVTMNSFKEWAEGGLYRILRWPVEVMMLNLQCYCFHNHLFTSMIFLIFIDCSFARGCVVRAKLEISVKATKVQTLNFLRLAIGSISLWSKLGISCKPYSMNTTRHFYPNFLHVKSQVHIDKKKFWLWYNQYHWTLFSNLE